jgi:hypothetical protein
MFCFFLCLLFWGQFKVNAFKESYNKGNTKFYTYSDVRQTGDYWCYVDGVATKWADIPEEE